MVRFAARIKSRLTFFVMIICTIYVLSNKLIFQHNGHKDSRKVHKDVECGNLSFSSNPLPRTALASYPGSGNTWLRHLLQKMTGIITGSVHTDKDLNDHGFPGEGHTDSSGWKSFIDNTSKSYRKFYLSWIKHQHVLLVQYDDLKADLPSTLRRIYTFLSNDNLQLKENVRCYLEDQEGSFHRNPSAMPLAFFYSKLTISEINNIILELHKEFSERFNNNTVYYMLNWVIK